MYVPSIIGFLLIASSVAFRHGDLTSGNHDLSNLRTRFWGNEELKGPSFRLDQDLAMERPSYRFWGLPGGILKCISEQTTVETAAVVKKHWPEVWTLVKQIMGNLFGFHLSGAFQAFLSLLRLLLKDEVLPVFKNFPHAIWECLRWEFLQVHF